MFLMNRNVCGCAVFGMPSGKQGFFPLCGGRPLEEGSEIRQIGGGVGWLGGDDCPAMVKEGAGHLQAIPREVANAAAFEYGNDAPPPDMRPEELEKTAFAKTEGAVEFTAWIGDAHDVGFLAEVGGFLPGLEHVDKDEAGVVAFCLFFEVLETAQNLPCEGASEVAQENENEHLFLRSFLQAAPVRKSIDP